MIVTATAEIVADFHPNTGELRKKARVLDGPYAGTAFLLYNPRRSFWLGEEVTIEFCPDDQFATVK